MTTSKSEKVAVRLPKEVIKFYRVAARKKKLKGGGAEMRLVLTSYARKASALDKADVKVKKAVKAHSKPRLVVKGKKTAKKTKKTAKRKAPTVATVRLMQNVMHKRRELRKAGKRRKAA